MKKVTSSNYKKDKYYKSVTKAVHEILKKSTVVAPIDVFIEIGNLTKEKYEDWRFARVPYLEKVITCNLSKANRILRVLRYHALAPWAEAVAHDLPEMGKRAKEDCT